MKQTRQRTLTNPLTISPDSIIGHVLYLKINKLLQQHRFNIHNTAPAARPAAPHTPKNPNHKPPAHASSCSAAFNCNSLRHHSAIKIKNQFLIPGSIVEHCALYDVMYVTSFELPVPFSSRESSFSSTRLTTRLPTSLLARSARRGARGARRGVAAHSTPTAHSTHTHQRSPGM